MIFVSNKIYTIMRNLKKALVQHILERTPQNEIPAVVDKSFNGDYKMYLYTLKTSELGELIMIR
tara:strand:- start:782 stop:973 length:192 start_codon:yes stop_codon:yes gene_type:complete